MAPGRLRASPVRRTCAVGSPACLHLSSSPRSSAPGSWRATTTARSSRSAADGSVAWSVGDVDDADPAALVQQAAAGARHAAGRARPDGELLALACASHSGEPFHLDGVRRILAGAGLDEAALQTPPDYPLDDAGARGAASARAASKSSIAMNCSGKHAAMLATCVANGWDTATYLDPDAPAAAGDRRDLRRADRRAGRGRRRRRLRRAAAVRRRWSGWPARSGALALRDRRARSGAVADAIRAHPEYVSGTRRDEAALLRAVPGAIGKAGAESCYAVGAAGRPRGRAEDRRRRAPGCGRC